MLKQVCVVSLYLLQHHVKVLLLNLLSELATFIDQLCTKRLLTHIRIMCNVLCNVLCSLWTILIFNPFVTLFYNIYHQCVCRAKLCKCIFLNFNLVCNFEI